jgi:antitoxin YefM
MQIINFSIAKINLSDTLDKVVKNSEPVVVTRENKEPVVILSLSDYKALEETIYLMQSINNAKRLNRSIKQLENGLGKQKELIEE